MQKPVEQTNNREGALRARIAEVRGRVEGAARRAGRAAGEITLIAVSKTHPAEAVRLARGAGLTDFGENRVQEALPKIEAVAGDGEIAWHLIGHLQRNKAREAAGRFGLIHSVDSVRLIEALESAAARAGVMQRILLQISLAGEAQKAGAEPEGLPGLIEALASAPHLRCEGLMTVPPYSEDAEQSRPYFRRLREMLGTLREAGNVTPRHLSMGMSGDFEVAIEEGATMIRVGTALFGERPSAG